MNAAPGTVFANPGFRLVRHTERGHGRFLNEARKTEQHALRHGLGMDHELGRAHQPAGTPTGHGMRLGQAAEGHALLGQSGGEARHTAAGSESRIHFVRHHPQRMAACQLPDHG